METEMINETPKRDQLKSLITRVMVAPEVGVFIPLLILCIVTTLLNPSFISARNMLSVFRLLTFVAIVAIGESLVIMIGEIDLSVGQIAGFCTFVFAFLLVILKQSLLLALGVTLLTGVIMGFINGYLVAYLKISNFVATLGMMFVGQGLKNFITTGMPIYPLPDALQNFGAMSPLGLSWGFFIAVALYLIFDFLLRKTVFGRRVFAVGNNKEAALLSGINVKWVQTGIYVISGLLAATAGILLAIETNGAQNGSGDGWEFTAIASTVVGGISMMGGVGSMLGTAIGVVMVSMLNDSLIVLGVDPNVQTILTGVVLVGAVLLDIIRRDRTSGA